MEPSSPALQLYSLIAAVFFTTSATREAQKACVMQQCKPHLTTEHFFLAIPGTPQNWQFPEHRVMWVKKQYPPRQAQYRSVHLGWWFHQSLLLWMWRARKSPCYDVLSGESWTALSLSFSSAKWKQHKVVSRMNEIIDYWVYNCLTHNKTQRMLAITFKKSY